MGTTPVLPLSVLLCLLASAPAGAGSVRFLPSDRGFDPVQEQAQAPATPDNEKPKKPKKKGGSTDDASGAEKPGKDEVRMTWKDGPSLRLGKHGRVDFTLLLQGDFRNSDQDLEPSGGTFSSPRSRAGVQGELFKVVEFEVEKDFDGPWRDAFVNARPVSEVQVQAGKFKVPFSLEQLTSGSSLDFLYRSLAGRILAPDRDIGVMVHGSVLKRFVRYQLGFFKGGGENAPSLEYPPMLPGEVPDAPSKRSVAGRLRVRPLLPLPAPEFFDTLEIGFSAMRSEIPEGFNHLHGETLFGTKLFSRQYYVNGARNRESFETSWTPGPASFRAEYIRVEEAREGVGAGDEGGLDSTLFPLPSSGWYVSGTWALTGEKKESGVVPKRPFLQGGLGAIEVAARYEKIQFGGGDASQPPSDSPRADYTLRSDEEIVTLGVNWYFNRFVRMQLNGIREKVSDPATSPIPGQPSVWTVALRLQWHM